MLGDHQWASSWYRLVSRATKPISLDYCTRVATSETTASDKGALPEILPQGKLKAVRVSALTRSSGSQCNGNRFYVSQVYRYEERKTPENVFCGPTLQLYATFVGTLISSNPYECIDFSNILVPIGLPEHLVLSSF